MGQQLRRQAHNLEIASASLARATKMIVVVCPFFFCTDPERADITRRMFRHYAGMPIAFLGIGSEGDISRELFCESFPESQYLEYEQYWAPGTIGPSGSTGLRRKFNAAVRAARKYEPETVFLIGSDDLIDERFFEPSDEELVGLGLGTDGGCHYWPYGLDVSYWWYGSSRGPQIELAGGALGLSTELLDKLEWEPFQFDGDEIGVTKFVRETTGSIEKRYGMPPWHPKARTTVLNTLANINLNFTLLTDDPLLTEEFLAYWDALGDGEPTIRKSHACPSTPLVSPLSKKS